MADDVSAGRLHLDAYIDTAGATRGLQKRLDAETAKIKAKIKAEIDARSAVVSAKKAAVEAQRAHKVTLKAEVDKESLVRSTRVAVANVERTVKVRLKAEVDQASLDRSARAASSRSSQQQPAPQATPQAAASKKALGAEPVTINLDVDTTKATAKLAAWRAAQRANDVSVDVKTNGAEAASGAADGVASAFQTATGAAAEFLMTVSKVPMIVGGIYSAVSAVGRLGGALVAMVGSASQAVYALAALPNLFGILLQGIGALLIGFNGIGAALQGMGQQAKSSATDTEQAAKVQVDSARRIADAKRALSNALHQQADAARASSNAIEDAEWAAARAHEAARDAQESLNDARKEARERIRDLNTELKLSRGEEEAAMAALVAAQEELQDVKWDASSSERERRAAEERVKEAERNVTRTREQNRDLAREAKKANKEGVEGSDEVKAAKDAVRDANHAAAESEQALAQARHDAADSARANAQAVADARRAIADAQTAGAEAAAQQSVAQANLAWAMDQLTPAGQRFANFLWSLKPRWEEFKGAIATSILPPLQTAITRAMPLLDTLQAGLVRSGQVVGGVAKKMGTLMGSKGFNQDVSKVMGSNNRAMKDFGGVAVNLVAVLTKLARAAGPILVEPFAKWLRTVTKTWRETLNTREGFARLEDRLRSGRDIVVSLWRTFRNLAGILHDVGVAGDDTGKSLWDTLEGTTARWEKWTSSDDGQAKMKAFFDATRPVIKAFGDLLAAVGELFIKMSEGQGTPIIWFFKTLTTMLNGVSKAFEVPGVSEFVGWMMVLAGVGGALGMVSGMLLKIVGGIARFKAIYTGYVKVMEWGRRIALGTRIQLAALWVQQKLMTVWTRAAAVAQRVWTVVTTAAAGAMRLLSLAFAANPIGVVILAIIALVGLFVLLYRRVDWFRRGVDAAVGWIVDAFQSLWDFVRDLWDDWFGHSIFPDMLAAFGRIFSAIGRVISLFVAGFRAGARIVGAVVRVLGKVVRAAFKVIRTVIRGAWAVVKAIFRGWRLQVRILGAIIKWLWAKMVKPYFTLIRTIIAFVWNKVVKPIFTRFVQGLKNIGTWFKKMWNTYIKPAWNSLKNAIVNVWKNHIKKVFDKLGNFIKNTLPDAFEDGVAAIKGWWDDLKEIAKSPVKFMVNTVYMKGIKPLIDAIPGVGNLPSLSFATGGVLPGYTPGRDPHHFVNPRTGQTLDASGGEAFMRPEWTRMVGERAVNTWNAAARKGKSALARAMYGGQQAFARGGILGRSPRLRYWLGGTLPLPGATSISAHDTSKGTYKGYPYAGDLNWPGRADYGKPIVAWKSGIASPFDLGSDRSYGRGQVIVGNGGQSHLYAHMSKVVTSLAGKMVRAGQTIGYVGDYGNTGSPPTSHLHFEVRNGAVNLGDGATGGGSAPDPRVAKAKEKASSWKDTIAKILNGVKSIPGMLTEVKKFKMWGDMFRKSIGSVGDKAIQWINDKIPNSIKIPGPVPDIPLPDNPIGSPFDRGGSLYPGSTLAWNGTGKVETVFTNEQITRLTESLARLSRDLVTVAAPAAAGGGSGALVEHLHLSVGDKRDVKPVMRDTNRELRKIELGGVHANTPR